MMHLMVLNRQEEALTPIQVTNVNRHRELSGEDSLSFDCSDTAIETGFRVLLPERMVGATRNEGAEYVVSEIIENREGLSVTCSSALDDLFLYFIPVLSIKGTAQQVITVLLQGTNRELTGVIGDTKEYEFVFDRISVREALAQVQEALGGWEIQAYSQWDAYQLTGRYLNFYEQIGSVTDQTFEFGHSMTKLIRTYSAQPVITRLYAYGDTVATYDSDGKRTPDSDYPLSIAPVNYGLDFIEDLEALEKYGRGTAREHNTGWVSFPDVVDAEELLRLAQEELKRRAVPAINYTAAVIDLKQAGSQEHTVGLGDYVRVIDRVLGIDEEARVTALSEWPEGYRSNEIRLSVGTDARLNRAVQKLKEDASLRRRLQGAATEKSVRESQVNLVRNLLGHFRDQLNDGLAEGQINVYPGGFEFVAPDGESATQIGPFGYRTAKQRLPSGEWDWTTAITGHGLATGVVGAEQIIAGAISTDHISTAGIDADRINLTETQTLRERLTEVDQQVTTLEQTTNTITSEQTEITRRVTDIDSETGLVANVRDEVATVRADLIAISEKQTALESGQGNLLLNPTYGTGANPEDSYWQIGLTWREAKIRRITWTALENAGNTWAHIKRGDV